MSEIPSELKYSKSHEWVKTNDDETLTIGITEHAQELLGDMVYVELPKTGASVEAGGDCAVVESVKAASDIYAPVSGEIIEVNEVLADAPETINNDPYGEGWIFRLQPGNVGEMNQLLEAADYEKLVASEE